MSSILQYVGYGIAAFAYFVLAVLLATSFRGRLRGGLLFAASLITVVWAGILCWAAVSLSLSALQLMLVEVVLDAIWIVFLSGLLAGAIGSSGQFVARYGGISLIVCLAVVGVFLELSSENSNSQGLGNLLILGSILTSLFVLVALEQVYRNARESQRSGLKFLILGVGGIFGYDLLLYSNAILVGQMSETLWGARGVAVALCAPLIAVAAQRSPTWSVGVFVSRHVVFYTATLFGAGLYLTLFGLVGYYLGESGGSLGGFVQTVVSFGAILALLVFLLSDRVRRSTRVFISKHFFENRYDYREEWLRLIATLTSDEDALPLEKRAIKSFAQILDTQAGMLWMAEPETSRVYCVAGWNCAPTSPKSVASEGLVEFLRRTGWIVEIAEYENDLSHYDGLEFEITSLGMDRPGFILPLSNHGDFLGFVVLSARSSLGQLNFEDHDLLKTAGQQIASYLAQDITTEKLAEGRQFEAFNRLTAFLMHDLKNVIAQQSLIVDNSEKHKGKPEFVDDMIETIRGSVGRMRGIIEHLQQRSFDQSSQRIELTKVILKAVSQAADRMPEAHARLGDQQVWVRGDPDRLQMALLHAIRNSQDASSKDRLIEVRLIDSDTHAEITIADEGTGMDEDFVRERLFKPFDSTKGTQGMGIGAYQLRETVKAFRGEISVETTPGKGTCIAITLPKGRQK